MLSNCAVAWRKSFIEVRHQQMDLTFRISRTEQHLLVYSRVSVFPLTNYMHAFHAI